MLILKKAVNPKDNKIDLLVGCRVMLRNNINVSKHLVNRSIGTITKIDWPFLARNQMTSGNLAESIHIKSDDPSINEMFQDSFDLVNNSIKTKPMTVKFQDKK
jgi:hypothetical protein